jgi:hypothetical protein
MNTESFQCLRNYILKLYPKQRGEIDTFLVNTLLVLLKGRLCYRIDVDRLLRKYLIDTVKSLYDKILTINNDIEPLMYLTENTNKINQDMGIILGYCYIGPNWDNVAIDRYMVIPTVKSNDQETFLYTTMVPAYEFNNIKDKILIIQEFYQELLSTYGYTVSITIYDYPAYGKPNFKHNMNSILL